MNTCDCGGMSEGFLKGAIGHQMCVNSEATTVQVVCPNCSKILLITFTVENTIEELE